MTDPRTLTEPLATTYRAEQARLEIVAGPETGLARVFQGSIRLGSRPMVEVPLSDPKVSGVHCQLTIDGSGITVRDLGSKNGVFMGGFRVRDALVPQGQLVTIGDTQFRVKLIQATVEIPTLATTAYHGIIGRSGAMRALTAQLERLKSSDATVLIEGETGTGKERVADALHRSSHRSEKPLVVVDCGTLSATLVESQLFGHERGAFTGAESRQVGAFERAHGGTLFLDEIGELPLGLQVKLLGALERRQVQPLGATAPLAVDVRIIAATNRDLAVEVSKGRFREDLYYRLSVVHLKVPPLRERREDIPLLTIEFLAQLGLDPQEVLTPKTLADLERYDWPGNVRELKNTLERAGVLMEPPRAASPAKAPVQLPGVVDTQTPLLEGRAQLIAAYESAYLGKLLEECRGNVSEVARRAQMDRMTVHRMLLKLNLR
ncbi:MAG: sigma 54-dependent Fis family transcriptional regulator [Archangiaceae bacterium]|nr:sigma 54-dependent Fis family transcriptional regulator [Archangiaceae bacterium]